MRDRRSRPAPRKAVHSVFRIPFELSPTPQRWTSFQFEGWTFHECADEAAEAVVIGLHGFTGSGLDFTPLAQAMAPHRRWSWIAPDLPGHGATGALDPASRSSLPEMAATLRRLAAARALRPLVLGYSMGARLALEWATGPGKDEIEKLILIGATAGIEDAELRAVRCREDQALAERIRAIGVERFAGEWERTPIIRSQKRIPSPALQAMQTRRRSQSVSGLAQSLLHAGTGAMLPRWEYLHTVTASTLILSGEEDPKFMALGQRLAKQIPSAEFHTIPNAGHCAHLENPSEFISLLLRF